MDGVVALSALCFLLCRCGDLRPFFDLPGRLAIPQLNSQKAGDSFTRSIIGRRQGSKHSYKVAAAEGTRFHAD
jgi:hypothetical protein